MKLKSKHGGVYKLVLTKEWWKSKTLWASGLTIVAGIFVALADHLVTGGALSVVGLVNLILRVVTDSSIEF